MSNPLVKSYGPNFKMLSAKTVAVRNSLKEWSEVLIIKNREDYKKGIVDTKSD
jgi:hypothetical protein